VNDPQTGTTVKPDQQSMGQQGKYPSSSPTGVDNRVYDMVSVNYHATKEGWHCIQYIQDAQQMGDQELEQFFQQVQQEDQQRAVRAQQLLASRLPH
jgi:hypothetical protein